MTISIIETLPTRFPDSPQSVNYWSYMNQLHLAGIDANSIPSRQASLSDARYLHDTEYVNRVSGGYSNEWTGMRPDLSLLEFTRLGASLQAANLIYRDQARRVFVPSAGGIHASRTESGYGDTFNDATAAACWLERRGVSSLLIDLTGVPSPSLESQAPLSYTFARAGAGLDPDVVDDCMTELSDLVDRQSPEVILLVVSAAVFEDSPMTDHDLNPTDLYSAVSYISHLADETSNSRLIGYGSSLDPHQEWCPFSWLVATRALALPYTTPTPNSPQERASAA